MVLTHFIFVASAICGAVRPLAEVQTQSSFVGLLDSKMVWYCGEGEGEETSAVFVVVVCICIQLCPKDP